VTLHILLAEDENVIAMTLADALECEGFRVTLAGDGRQALEAERRDKADLLVTDMRMPVMGGAELIRFIRQDRPDLPVIAITGYSDTIPADEKDRLVVLHKPFHLAKLVDTIRSLSAAAGLLNEKTGLTG
jgi:CheY-like chemotaxis protein